MVCRADPGFQVVALLKSASVDATFNFPSNRYLEGRAFLPTPRLSSRAMTIRPMQGSDAHLTWVSLWPAVCDGFQTVATSAENCAAEVWRTGESKDCLTVRAS